MNTFDANKYKWRGLNPRINRCYWFHPKPRLEKGANYRCVHFLWWRFTFSWLWNPHVIWNDGWDACFRQNLHKDEIIESTKVYNRKN